jgi:8-oxo-dGTP pyrophosphatase MutT (NUDIX family)
MIEAAGGLLWKVTAGTTEIALVHRKRYGGDWTLPKGKLKPDETPLAAALREVREETGCETTVIDFAGVISYETTHGPKRVLFWNMAVESQSTESLDTSEVIETVWLSPKDALERMSYPLERAILEIALDGQPIACDYQYHPHQPGFWQKFRHRLYLQDIARINLELLFPVLATEFNGLCQEVKRNHITISAAWQPRVKALLEHAKQNIFSDPELAWRFAKAADRALVFGEDALHPGQANARASALLKEAKEKIPNWRGEAIQDLLDPQKTGHAEAVPIWKVVQALKLADEHQDNGFRRLQILRKRLRIYDGTSLVLIVAFLWMGPQIWANEKMAGSPGPCYAILSLVLMGLMGAAVSMLTSTQSVSSDRVPVQQAQGAILASRLALGPLSALAVVTILAALKEHEPNFITALAVAFASGFSERFVLASIEAFTKK